MHHLNNGGFQVNVSPGILVSGQKSRTHHNMMLRPMHMAKWLFHHLVDYFDRIPGCFLKAQADDNIHASRMALIADIVPVHAARLAIFLLVANCTLHELIRLQILERRFADYAFFFGHIKQSVKK
jgi:hypothetical protein